MSCFVQLFKLKTYIISWAHILSFQVTFSYIFPVKLVLIQFVHIKKGNNFFSKIIVHQISEKSPKKNNGRVDPPNFL